MTLPECGDADGRAVNVHKYAAGQRGRVRRTVVKLLLCAGVTVSPGLAAGESRLDTLERTLEMERHETLGAVKADAANSLSAFSTDGCSGGLSFGWRYASRQYPEFAGLHGGTPPWESCCVTHDRAYHTGGPRDATTEESFSARREADEILRQCVRETGQGRSSIVAEEYDVPVSRVRMLYIAVADLMYRAVRVGGVPCTGLPWRWGYGWPECP